MTSTNSSAEKQKIEDPAAEPQPMKLSVPWPPPGYVDTFTKPVGHIAILKNHLLPSICTLNSSRTAEEAKRLGDKAPTEIATVFSFSKKAEPPKPNQFDSTNWMMQRVPDIQGDAKVFIIHRDTGMYISTVREKFGNVVLKYHSVPHPIHFGVFAISEIYVLPAGAEGDLMLGAAKVRCFTCSRNGALGTCMCETVSFCTMLCRDAAVRLGKHTEEMCRTAMVDSVLKEATEARRIMNNVKIANDAHKEAVDAQSKHMAERAEAAQKMLETMPDAKPLKTVTGESVVFEEAAAEQKTDDKTTATVEDAPEN